MKKYTIKIEVDVDKLRSETENNDDTIKWLVENEFGWLDSSGIYFKEINERK